MPAQAHLLTWEEAACYGLTYFTAYRMLIDQAKIQSGDRVLIWGAAGGLGVFAIQLCRLAGADCVGVVSSATRASCAALGACDVIDRNDFAGMMRRGARPRGGGRARQGVAPVRQARQGAAGRPARRRLRARRPRDVPDDACSTVKPFGKVVICGATSGYQLDFDVRYLWMRQKQIIGSHFANAYEATRANELIESGKIRPVLWKTMPFDGVAEAHQSMYKNEHLGKIAILVGAEAEGLGATAEGPGAIRAEVGA